jgi:hypothetical protein
MLHNLIVDSVPTKHINKASMDTFMDTTAVPMFNYAQHHEDIWRSGGMKPLILNVCTRYTLNGQLHRLPNHYPLIQACSSFYMVRETEAKFGLHAANMKFNTKIENE